MRLISSLVQCAPVVAAVHSVEVALGSRVPLPSFALVVAAVRSAEVALASRVPLPSFAPVVDAVHSADVALPFFLLLMFRDRFASCFQLLCRINVIICRCQPRTFHSQSLRPTAGRHDVHSNVSTTVKRKQIKDTLSAE